MIIQEPVQAAIWHCLNSYDHKDAVFLSERLCSEVETDETIFLLATSYYRSNMIHQAYWLLKEKSRPTAQCRFLLAKCAYQLKRYSEAENALANGGFGDFKIFDDLTKDFGEIACFALQLASQICIKTERYKIATEALRRALKLNPFMWQAYAELCHLGENVDAASVFQITSTDIFKTCQSSLSSNSVVVIGGGSGLNDSIMNHFNPFMANAVLQNITPVSDGSLNNSSHCVLSTPVDQQQQQSQNNSSLLITPNNNLNSSISMLRGNTAITQNALPMALEDTPVGWMNTCHAQDSGAGTPLRKQFKCLTSLSPLTPSFGVLPIASPCSGDSSFVAGINTGSTQSFNMNLTNSPQLQTLGEVNMEQKIIGKKFKAHTSNMMSRKDTGSNMNSGKVAVFTQTANITPRTPNNGGSVSIGAPNAAVRRSSRLFSSNSYSVKENTKSPNITGKQFAQPRSPPRKTKARMTKICLNNELIEEKCVNSNTDKLNEKNSRKEKEKIETITSAASNNRTTEDTKVLINNSLNSAQTMLHHVLTLKKQSADGLMTLLQDMGEAYKSLTRYECKAAIKHLEAHIPKHHLLSSWVQSLIAVSHYELREYEAAVSIFQRIHEAQPHRLEYMEIYSSSLWHLQREVDLSALSQDLITQDRLSAVTWCVAGNCFSLHKEHETAIKYFRRAVQVDPDFVYSYTLLGHELVLTEELEKAMDSFRSAIMRNPRHYYAWFGIGTIYSKQEKYDLAELHYGRALKINPRNSVILVHIGAMQYFMQKKEQALQTLNTAAALDPKNPLARFHRGSIYFSLGRHQEALRELEELKEIVPKESVVFYLIGKIHKSLGNVDLALMHFSWATDLDPKGANNQIKDVFDSMSHPACCPSISEPSADPDLDPISERSDDSTQAQQEANYDSDAYFIA